MSTPVDKFWTPWIVRAITQHFNDIDMFIQHSGMPSETSQHDTWAMIRHDGPYFKRLNPPNIFRGFIQVDILIQAPALGDIYRMANLAGEVAELFTCIDVLDNDDNSIGVLTLTPWSDDRDIDIINFGKIPDIDHERCAVIGDYRIDLEAT